MESITELVNDNKTLKIESYYLDTYTNYSMQYHKHAYIEIMYVVSGVCTILLHTAEKNKEHVLRKNDFIMIDSNVPHSLYVGKSQSAEIANIEFAIEKKSDEDLIDFKNISLAFTSMYSHLSESGYIIADDNGQVLETIKKIHTFCELKGKAKNKYSKNIIQHFDNNKLSYLILELMNEVNISEKQNNYFFSLIKQLFEYINTNYMNDISIQSASEEFKIHKSYVVIIFSKYSDTTFHKYLNETRILNAVKLFENNTNITDVGFEVGFNSRQSFYNAFTKVMKKSPFDYVKELKNKEKQNKRELDEHYVQEYLDHPIKVKN